MRAAQLSESELASALRHYGVCEVSQVRLASLEQNGTVSVVKKAAQVIEVEVQEGVQRVRIEMFDEEGNSLFGAIEQEIVAYQR